MVSLLQVSRSAYYAWRKATGRARKQENQRLKGLIQNLFLHNRECYGSPRIYQVLRKQGEQVGHNRVARLMRELGLHAVPKKRWKTTTQSNHRLPVVENHLDRAFRTDGPNEKWVADLTYVWTILGRCA